MSANRPRLEVPATPRFPPTRNSSLMLFREAEIAGAKPETTPAATESITAASNMRPSTAAESNRGIPPGFRRTNRGTAA